MASWICSPWEKERGGWVAERVVLGDSVRSDDVQGSGVVGFEFVVEFAVFVEVDVGLVVGDVKDVGFGGVGALPSFEEGIVDEDDVVFVGAVYGHGEVIFVVVEFSVGAADFEDVVVIGGGFPVYARHSLFDGAEMGWTVTWTWFSRVRKT